MMLAVSYAKRKIDQKLATLKGGVKSVFILKCRPSIFGQDCLYIHLKTSVVFSVQL